MCLGNAVSTTEITIWSGGLVCFNVFYCRFKFAVYKNLGHLETIDQIRAGRYMHCLLSHDVHVMFM